jgi:hypothetical protein
MSVDTTYNNEFEKQLEAAGYRWFKDNWKNSIRGFQKRITDDKGVKYFITGYHWNFKRQIPDFPEDRDSYSFDVQFIIKKDGKESVIDIGYGGDFFQNPWREVITLKDVEEFYEKAWNDMGVEYYELKEQ